jgi:hypothetical protein
MHDPTVATASTEPLFADVDWASTDHAVCVIDAAGAVVWRHTVTHSRAGLTRLVELGVTRVGIERGDGPVVEALLDSGLRVAVEISTFSGTRARQRAGGTCCRPCRGRWVPVRSAHPPFARTLAESRLATWPGLSGGWGGFGRRLGGGLGAAECRRRGGMGGLVGVMALACSGIGGTGCVPAWVPRIPSDGSHGGEGRRHGRRRFPGVAPV